MTFGRLKPVRPYFLMAKNVNELSFEGSAGGGKICFANPGDVEDVRQNFPGVLKLSSEMSTSPSVLRFLSGPLNGCEYVLEADRTLFLVGDEGDFVAAAMAPGFSRNTVVVPLRHQGGNFEIVLRSGEGNFLLRTLGEPVREQSCSYQKIYHAGGLRFVVRSATQEWASGVLEHGDDPAVVVKKCRRRAWLLRVFVVVSVGLASWGVVAMWGVLGDEKRVAEVRGVVSGSTQGYQIRKDGNGGVYVFAKSERDFSWARQALERANMAATKVFTTRGEEERVEKLLHDAYPRLAFHRLTLADAAHPRLLLSRERARMDATQRQSLVRQMLVWMPYARSVIVSEWSDESLVREAKSGLDRAGVAYLCQGGKDGVTFVVQGDVGDAELSLVQRFAHRFYQNFGSRYVYFVVGLKDEVLEGKSYKYGVHGYVKASPEHWVFN